MEIDRLEHDLEQCEAEGERLDEELREISDLTDQITDLESIVGTFENRAKQWTVRTRAYHEDLEEFTDRLDELETLIRNETGGVRHSFRDRMNHVVETLQEMEETVVDGREQRDEHWDHRTGELAQRLDEIEDNLEALREEFEDQDEGEDDGDDSGFSVLR